MRRENEDEDDRGDDHGHEAEAEDVGLHGKAGLERVGHNTRDGPGQVVVLGEGRVRARARVRGSGGDAAGRVAGYSEFECSTRTGAEVVQYLVGGSPQVSKKGWQGAS